MQITFFSFLMSLLWFNLYILIINIFRKNDKFIISFSILPIIFFMSLSIVRLIFNFEISGAVIIRSKNIFPVFYNLIKNPLNLNGYIITLSEILIFSWILVAIILLINGIYKYMGFRRKLERLSNDSSKESMELFNKVLKKIKLENKIEIVQNKNIYSPFVIGILKAKIYIPNISFSEKELEYIILHEANHFLKRDSLKKILIQGLKYLFWWNPFAHLFANNFNHILEIQCDLETTADFTNDEKIRYLETITKIIKNPRANITKSVSVPNLLNLEDIDSLKQRFKIILNYKKRQAY